MIKGTDASLHSLPPPRAGGAAGTPSPLVRHCRDCRHVRPDYAFVGGTLGLSRRGWRQSVEFASCAHPSAAREHTEERARDWVVTGRLSARPATTMSHCSAERGFAGAGRCGPDGRFWEPRGADAPGGWRDPAARRAVLREALRAWGWFLASASVGLAGGALLFWALAA